MNRNSVAFAGALLAVSASLAEETHTYRGVEIPLLSARAGEREYRINTFARAIADPGKELVILKFRFDASKAPTQQKVSLGHLRVVGSAGEGLVGRALDTVEGGAPVPLAGQDIILQVPAGSRPERAVIQVDEGQALTFQLDKLLKFPRSIETTDTKATIGDRILDDREFFSPDFAKSVRSAAAGKGAVVPAPRPEAAKFEQKYGKADKVELEIVSVENGPTAALAVHYYGDLGLGVANEVVMAVLKKK